MQIANIIKVYNQSCISVFHYRVLYLLRNSQLVYIIVVRYSAVSTEVKEGVTVTKLYLKNMFEHLHYKAYYALYILYRMIH